MAEKTKPEDAKPEDAVSKVREQMAQQGKELKKLEQELNKLTAIPRSSTGQTENLGNAPTPAPLEPTVNEPGNVMYVNPEPKAEEAKPA